MLSTDRHFHGLFRLAQHSGRDFRHDSIPVLFELDRADVMQGLVHTYLIIPEQPCDSFIVGLADGLKTLAV